MPKKKREEFLIEVSPYSDGLKEYIERLQSYLDIYPEENLIISLEADIEYDDYRKPCAASKVVITKEFKNV